MADGQIDPVEQRVDELLPMIRRAENSGDTAVSPKGAIGRYQIMPDTARSLGFDPAKLIDPATNEQAARAALKDLIRQHGIGDTKAIIAGYNASPRAVNNWKQSGRDDSKLPLETQHYFSRAGVADNVLSFVNRFGAAPNIAKPAPGQAQYQKYLDAGFSMDEAEQWKQQQQQQQRGAGFNEKEIESYWGSTPPDKTQLKDTVMRHLDQTTPEQQDEIVNDPMKAVQYGWRTSVAGLMLRGQNPGMVMPENAGMFNKVAASLTQSAIDIPYSVMGFVGGGAAAAPTAAFTGPVGPLMAGGAGAMALPNAMRSTLMDYYSHPNGYKTWREFAGDAGQILVDGLKDATTGAVSFGLGGKVGASVMGKTGSAGFSQGANLLTTATSATTVGAALDGHAPNAEDFVAAGATIIGVHAAGKVAGRIVPRIKASNATNEAAQNVRDIYASHGIKPDDLARMAAADPVVNGEVLSRNAFGEQITPTLDATWKTSPAKIADEHAEFMDRLYTQALQEAHDNMAAGKSPAGNVPGGDQIVKMNAATEEGKRLREEFRRRAIPADTYKDEGTPEEREAAVRARQKKKDTANKETATDNVHSFEDARTSRTLAILDEHDYGSPPPRGPEPEVANPGDMSAGPKITDDTIHLNYDMLADKFMEGKIAEQGKPSIWKNAKTIYRQFVTELFPARQLDDVFKPDSKNLGVEDMLRQTYASRERAGYFMRYGTLDPLSFEDTGGPSYLAGYEAVKEDGGNFDGFTAYRLAKRTVDLHARGIESGFDPKIAKAMVEKGKAQYGRGDQIVNANKDAALDYARESGVFSAKQAAAIKDANPSHIILRRVQEPGYNPPRGRGFGARRPVKKIEGSDLHIVDPTTADIENLHTIIAMADRNRAVGNIIAAIEMTEAARPKNDRTFTKIDDPKLLGDRPLSGEILDAQGNPVPEADQSALEPFLAHRAFNASADGNSFIYFRNGVAEVWRTKDPELAQLLRTSSPGPEMHFLMKTAEAFSKFARLGITGAPDFPLRSNVRAQFEASILGKDGGVPMADFFSGIMDVAGQTEAYKRWVANGGLGSSLVSMDTDYIKRDLNGLFEKTGTVDHVWNVIRHPIDALRTFRELIDSAARLGYAKRAEGNGLSPAKAAIEGRKAYIDNAERAGLAVVNNWARITPFLRTSVLDVDQFLRAVKERPIGTMMKGAAWVSIPTIANYLANYYGDQAHKDEPGFVPYSELPRWQKDMFYVLPPINGVRLRLPLKPYVSSFFFGTLVERFLDFAAKDDPRAFKEWGDSFMAQFLPSVIPALALPIWEQYSNNRTLSHKPMIPSNLEGASGYMQYTPDTSETAKAISRFLSPEVGAMSQWQKGVEVSPIVLENYARQWAGTLPFTILKALETPWHNDAHPWTVSDIPFVQSFVARNPGMSAVSIQDFYDAATAIDAHHKNLALATTRLQQGDLAGVGELKETSSVVQAYISLTEMKKALQNQAVVVRAINNSNKLTNSEKLMKIDALYGAMVKTAQGGLKLADAINGK